MIRQNPKYHNLGEFQKALLIHIAENEPTTINQLSESMGKDYRQTYDAHRKLTKYGLLKPVETTEYRGREFQTYWLTMYGIEQVLIDGADTELIKCLSKNVYGKTELYEWILAVCDYAKILGRAYLRTVIEILENGEENQLKISNLILPFNESLVSKIAQFLKDHPIVDAEARPVIKQVYDEVFKLEKKRGLTP